MLQHALWSHIEICTYIPAPQLYEKNLSCAFYPHGLGHNLGLDVHDVPGKASKPDGPSSDPKLRYLRIRALLCPFF